MKEYSHFLKTIFIPQKTPSSSSPTSSAFPMLSNQPLPQATFILSVEPLAASVVYFLVGCFHWPDSTAFDRALTVGSQIVTILGSLGAVTPFYTGLVAELFKSGIIALTKPGLHESHADLLSFLRDIYSKYHKLSSVCQELLMSLPNISVDIVKQFDATFEKTLDEKKQKGLIKTLLQDIIGVQIGKDIFKKAMPVQPLEVLQKMGVNDPQFEDYNLPSLKDFWD